MQTFTYNLIKNVCLVFFLKKQTLEKTYYFARWRAKPANGDGNMSFPAYARTNYF